MAAGRLPGILAGCFYAVGVTLLGFVLGAFVGGRVLGSGMGFDRLADMLGGAMVGALGGLLISIFTLKWLAPRLRLLGGLVAIFCIVLFGVVLRTYPPARWESSTIASDPEGFEPAFVVTLSPANPAGSDASDLIALPWETLTVRSIDRTLQFTTRGNGAKSCRAQLTDPLLSRVGAVLNGVAPTTVCAACADCLPYVMSWSLPNRRGGGIPVHADCLERDGALADLGSELRAVVAAPDFDCREYAN